MNACCITDLSSYLAADAQDSKGLNKSDGRRGKYNEYTQKQEAAQKMWEWVCGCCLGVTLVQSFFGYGATLRDTARAAGHASGAFVLQMLEVQTLQWGIG